MRNFDAIGCGKPAGQLGLRHPTAHDHQVGDHELRAAFGHRPFTIGEARSLGVTFKKLSGPAYRRLFRGVYADAETAELGVADGEVVRAVRRMIGGSAVIDGLSAL